MFAPIRSRFRAAGAWRLALGALLGVAASQPAAAQPFLPDQAPGRQEAKQDAEPLPQPFRMRESQVDFGVVRPNASKKTEVELFNSSKHPIRLTRVTSTCTCTAGLIEGAEVVPPGGVGKIEIGVKANPNLGPINQRVTVWYLDPNTGREGRFVVPVVGEVALAVKTDPFFINLLREDKAGAIEVVSTDGRPFRVLSFAGDAPEFDQSQLPEGRDPASQPVERAVIRYDFTSMPVGEIPDYFLLETDHPEAPVVALRVVHPGLIARAQDRSKRPWSVSQDAFTLGSVAPGDAVEHTITVVGLRLADEFETTAEGDVQVEVVGVEPAEKGKLVTLRFTVDPNASGLLREQFTLINGPERMTFNIFAKSSPGA